LWGNRIFLFGRYEEDFDASSQEEEASQLIGAVRERLRDAKLMPFSEIANALDAVPWDVLMACRRLVRMGLAREGTGKRRGSFRRVT
jgi:hypothetical protein